MGLPMVLSIRSWKYPMEKGACATSRGNLGSTILMVKSYLLTSKRYCFNLTPLFLVLLPWTAMKRLPSTSSWPLYSSRKDVIKPQFITVFPITEGDHIGWEVNTANLCCNLTHCATILLYFLMLTAHAHVNSDGLYTFTPSTALHKGLSLTYGPQKSWVTAWPVSLNCYTKTIKFVHFYTTSMQGQHTSHRKYIYSRFSPNQQVWPETNTVISSLMWQKNTPPNTQRSVLEDVIRGTAQCFHINLVHSWKRQDDARSPQQKSKQCFLARNEGGHIHKEIGSGTDAVQKRMQEQSTGIALMQTALSHTQQQRTWPMIIAFLSKQKETACARPTKTKDKSVLQWSTSKLELYGITELQNGWVWKGPSRMSRFNHPTIDT